MSRRLIAMAYFGRFVIYAAVVAISLKSSSGREARPSSTLTPPPPPTEAPAGDTITLSADQAEAVANQTARLDQEITASRTKGDRLFLDDEVSAPFNLTEDQSSKVSKIFPWIGLKPEITFPIRMRAVCPSELKGTLIYIWYKGVLFWIVNTITVSECGEQIDACFPQNPQGCSCCEATMVVPSIGIDIGSCFGGICLVKYLPLKIPFCTCCYCS